MINERDFLGGHPLFVGGADAEPLPSALARLRLRTLLAHGFGDSRGAETLFDPVPGSASPPETRYPAAGGCDVLKLDQVPRLLRGRGPR
jgi:hypothetical protein